MRLLSGRVDGMFVPGPEGVTVPASLRERLLSDPEHILALFAVAKRHRSGVHHDLMDRVRSAAEVQGEAAFRAPGALLRFREILAQPGHLAETLSSMHASGVLEKLIPEFAAVTQLVQFNRYHRYTVDRHTLEVIRTAESLAGSPGPDGPGAYLRKAYREIHRRDLLHLAMLLHDIGKGARGDHSAAGAGIAAAVGTRLGYARDDTSLLIFLVREHLTMEQVAFRRDLSDAKVLLRFARTVATAETLRMLYVLTYSDVAGVGPGSWTGWKEELLTDLYLKVLDQLTGSREVPSPDERLEVVRREVRAALGERTLAGTGWVEDQLREMNRRYALVTPPGTIARHLEWLADLAPEDVRARGENQPGSGATEYTVLTRESVTLGIFSKIAGVLAAKGLGVLRAQVDTWSNDVVVDTFTVTDTFFSGPPPASRLTEVEEAIRDVLLGRDTVEALFRRHRRFGHEPPVPPLAEPTQIEVDQESSDAFTVVEVFAHDRHGLLYAIAEALRELGLNVHSAQVATRLDQVLDVFYVTEADGRPVLEADRVSVIRAALTARIDGLGERPDI
ncbi:MAG: HD domain-containing protein [Gemmatimonadetes bacterium]|nr:HD domain-containing protein [Gemmatimonadota bacterium]